MSPFTNRHQSLNDGRYLGRYSNDTATTSSTFFCLVSPAIVFLRTLYILPIDHTGTSLTQAGGSQSSFFFESLTEAIMCRMLGVLSLAYVAIFMMTVVHCDDSIKESMDFLIKDTDVGRTFGHNALKRLSFIFLPVMFTLGVISTLLMSLAVISVKNLAIGVVLLIVAVSQAVSRLFASAIPAPAPLVFHPRAEFLPGPAIPAPWPSNGPLLSPWARSDNDANIAD